MTGGVILVDTLNLTIEPNHRTERKNPLRGALAEIDIVDVVSRICSERSALI